MLKKTAFAMTAAMVLGTAGIGAAHAQGGPGGGRHHDPLLTGVTLTDSQKSQLEALRKAGWQSNKALFTQVRAIEEKIDTALLSSGIVTEANLMPLLQQKAALEQQLETARLKRKIAERNLLTDDQLSAASSAHAQLAALHAQERALRNQPSDAPAASSADPG